MLSDIKVIDIMLAAIFLWFGFNGYRRGFFIEIFNTLALVAAVILGFMMLDMANALFIKLFGYNGTGSKIITCIVTIVILYFALSTVGAIIARILRGTILGSFDSIAGCTAGLMKALMLCCSIVWLLSFVKFKLPEKTTKGSYLYPIVAKSSPVIISLAGFLVPYAKTVYNNAHSHFRNKINTIDLPMSSGIDPKPKAFKKKKTEIFA